MKKGDLQLFHGKTMCNQTKEAAVTTSSLEVLNSREAKNNILKHVFRCDRGSAAKYVQKLFKCLSFSEKKMKTGVAVALDFSKVGAPLRTQKKAQSSKITHIWFEC